MLGLGSAGSLTAALGAQDDAQRPMGGLLGGYAMTREASGTSWQPDSTPMEGTMDMSGDWMTMWHGLANFVFDRQGGDRGGNQTFSNSMLMFMARRASDRGALGLRLMVSADPLMGPAGYPELFQTGETADGVHALVNRQHPHNLLMEAAATGSLDLGSGASVFGYAALAGEPALGPPAFMHRFSGQDDPAAPLSHHWLDSTHLAYGVLTAGLVRDRLKLEVSAFNGREPDQNRYQVELRGLDSWSVRLSCNPSPDLALQVSAGRLASPEQLEPQVAVLRTTASASYNRVAGALQWQTTLAWGHNRPDAGRASDALLLESAVRLDGSQTVFLRAERVGKDELFSPGQPLYGPAYVINALSLGYIYDFARLGPASLGAGVSATVYRYPAALDPAYGNAPASTLVFARIRL